MKKYHSNSGLLILLSLSLMTIIACVKDIDLNSDKCHDLHTFLHAKNVKKSCGSKAAFEDSKVCLCGYLNYEKSQPGEGFTSLTLSSVKQPASKINISFESSIRTELLSYLESNRGRKASLNAIVKGFDMPQQFKCVRGYEMYLQDISEVTFD